MRGSATRIIIGLTALGGLCWPAERGSAQATVEGTVFDSLARAPLAGATVSLVPDDNRAASYTATADARGRYTLRNVEPGVYVAGFFHPLLDSIGIEAPVHRVTIRDRSGTTHINMGVPSGRTIREAVCGSRDEDDSSGVFVGHVQNASTRGLSMGATVTAQWVKYTIANGTLAMSLPTFVAKTTAAGWFAFCGLPVETEISFVAVAGNDSSGIVNYEVPSLSAVHHDFYVARVERVAHALPPDSATAGDSLATPTEILRRGPARLRGIVRTAAQRSPLSGVQIGIVGTGLSTTTNDQGEFDLAQLPPGTQTLFARKVGYFPSEQVVNLFADDSARLEFTMPTVKSVLDTVKIIGRRVLSSDRSGFYRRQKTGMGHYFDANQVAHIRPFRTSDLLRRVPGVRINSSGIDRMALVRGSMSAWCQPMIFIDGMPMHELDLGDLDAMVSPDEVRGMEMYTSSIGVPGEFMMAFQSCGAIVVWTQPALRRRR